MRLFHFSDDPSINLFTPRPVRVPSSRRPGMEWLNGPLVWLSTIGTSRSTFSLGNVRAF
jgi:hypothetical protein